MRTRILLIAVMAAMLASYAGAAMSQTSPSETLLDANSLPKATSLDEVKSVARLDIIIPAKAQTFTAINSGALTSAQIQMYKECETPGDVRMQIATVDDSGLPTNNILAETTLPASAFVTDVSHGIVGELVTVTFSDPAQVKAGQKYAFIFRLESPTGDCPYLQPLKGDVYAGGAYAYVPEGGGGWGLVTEYDHIFAIYVTPPSGPTSKADCKKGGYKEFGFKNEGRCITFVNRAAQGQ